MQKIDLMVELSHLEYNRSKYSECLAICEAAKDLIIESDSSSRKLPLAHILMGMSWSLSRMDRNMEAALAAKEAADLYLELGDSQYAKSMNTAGDFFFFDRQWEFAYDCYQAVILNPLPETEDFDVAVAFSNSGLALSKMRKYAEAITAFTEARKQYKALRDVENVGFCDSEISRSYSQLGDGVTAEAFASASLDVAVTINKSRRVIWALYRLGRAQQVQNRHEEAIETFTNVLQKMKCSPAHWDESTIFVEAFKARSIRALGDEESALEIERRLRNVAEIAFEPAELSEWLELLPE